MAWQLTDDITLNAVKELLTQPARSAAIVALAIIDKALTAGLRYHLPGSGRTLDELFEPPKGKLADYDAKIKLAYVMGLVGKAGYSDLTKMGAIRNSFAHRLDISEFDHPLIAGLCADLQLIDSHVFELGLMSVPQRKDSRLCTSKRWRRSGTFRVSASTSPRCS